MNDDTVSDAVIEADREYRRILRLMKKKGLTIDDMPLDVQESMLMLHQNSLLLSVHRSDNP